MLIDTENYVGVASELTSIYVDAAVRLLMEVGNVAVMKTETNWSLVFLAT